MSRQLHTGTNYPAPLYYVGPNQVNLQIPYEVTGTVDLELGNPYQYYDYYFTVSSSALASTPISMALAT